MKIDNIRRQIKEFFGKDPMRPFVCVWIGVFAGIFVVAVVIYAALNSNNARIRRESAGFRAQVQALSALNVTPGNIQEVMGRIRADADASAAIFLKEPDIPRVIQNISQAATSHQVVLKKVNSLAGDNLEGFAIKSIPITLQIEGEYSSMGNFLAAVKLATEWLYVIEEARLTGDVKRSGRITANLKLTFFSRV